MTISININITCDPADIAALIQTITTPGAGLTKSDITTLIDHTIHQLGLTPPAEPLPTGNEATAPIITAPKPKRALGRPAKRPAPAGIIHETPSTGHPFISSDLWPEPTEATAATTIHPIAPITPIDPSDESDEKKIAKRLSFAELDPLVRSEMKRLSMDGRMPNTKLWDTERDPRLPTMTGLYYRYNVANMLDLAAIMGLQPPLTYKNTNGAQPITA